MSSDTVLDYTHGVSLHRPNTIYVRVDETGASSDDGAYCYMDVAAWGGIAIDNNNCTMDVTGCASASGSSFCHGEITLTVDANEDTHVAFGVSPSGLGADDFRGMVDIYPQLQTNGTDTVPSGLRLANLSPTSPDYHTLEDVNCKLLTVDSRGHLQLVEYMPERCAGDSTSPSDSCGPAAGGTFDSFPSNTACPDGYSRLFSGPNTLSGVPWSYTRQCQNDSTGEI